MPTINNVTNGGFSFNASRTVTLSATATAGRTILVGFVSSAAPTGVTDNGGSTPTYTQDRSQAISTGNMYWYRRTNISDTPSTVTINFGASAGIYGVTVLEVSDLTNSSPLGQSATRNTRAFTRSPSVSPTTETANE